METLYFDKDTMKFISNQKAVLSMVNSAYRKYGIFIEQAIELGYKFVCGFPNKKSAPGLKKLTFLMMNSNKKRVIQMQYTR